MPELVLLVQFDNESGGAFFEYESTAELFDGLCRLYERGLKLTQVGKNTDDFVSYELSDLLSYLDALPSLRVFHSSGVKQWKELDAEWAKAGLVQHMRLQASSLGDN